MVNAQEWIAMSIIQVPNKNKDRLVMDMCTQVAVMFQAKHKRLFQET